MADNSGSGGTADKSRVWWVLAIVAAGLAVLIPTLWPDGTPKELVGDSAGVENVSDDVDPQPDPGAVLDLQNWRWVEIQGGPASLPSEAPRVRIDGELVSEGDGWWFSPDGFAWRQEERPEELGPTVRLAQVEDEVWALAVSGPPFRHTKEGWQEVPLPDLPDEPFGLFPDPVALGDTVLVTGWTFRQGRNLAWVSFDGGVTFAGVDVPWQNQENAIVGSLATEQGFVAFGPPGEPGGVAVWTSSDGTTWTAQEAAFGGEVVDAAQVFDTGRPYWATTFTASGTDQLWSSGDGINWRERPPLGPTFQSGTTSLYQAEFGLVAIAFANLPDASQTGNDQIAVGLSVDGGSWLDVSDVRIMYPGETPGNVGGSMGWSVVGDQVFVVRTFEGGQRTMWVGSFEG